MGWCAVTTCQCGCGRPAPIAKKNYPKLGIKIGDPRKYILGHSSHVPEPSIDEKTGCWLWSGRLNHGGYAHNVYRKNYAKKFGPIPKGAHLDHLCRNRRCINPDHLEVVSPKENTRRGAAAKLTAMDAESIIAQIATRTPYKQIAQHFGVTVQTVCDIKVGRSWSELLRPWRVQHAA